MVIVIDDRECVIEKCLLKVFLSSSNATYIYKYPANPLIYVPIQACFIYILYLYILDIFSCSQNIYTNAGEEDTSAKFKKSW